MEALKQYAVDYKPALLKVLPIIGGIGTCASLLLFVIAPSWPTPDKLLIFLAFVFMIFGKSIELLKKLVPFTLLLLAYESLRGLVPSLTSRVEYQWMIDVDRFIGGGTLPTTWLQDRLWTGSARWFDFVLYGIYMLHFILPFALALLIWKYRSKQYWRYIATFIALSFAGFLTFLAMPAAPPWLASEKGYIEPITRVSSDVWFRLGIEDFPSVYNKISPNPVAAVPSLHAAYATLICIFVWRLFGRRAGLVAMLYPLAIYFGTVYQGEHYLIDEIIGSLYAVAIYALVAYMYPRITKRLQLKGSRHKASRAKNK